VVVEPVETTSESANAVGWCFLWSLSLSKHRNVLLEPCTKAKATVVSTGSTTTLNALVEPVVAELVEASKRPASLLMRLDGVFYGR